MELEPVQIDPKKLDAKSPNSWIALGFVEMRGGNLAGAKASLEQAMALGERATRLPSPRRAPLGKVAYGRFGFMGTDARGAASFGGRPDDD